MSVPPINEIVVCCLEFRRAYTAPKYPQLGTVTISSNSVGKRGRSAGDSVSEAPECSGAPHNTAQWRFDRPSKTWYVGKVNDQLDRV